MPPKKHLPEAPVIFTFKLPIEKDVPVPAEAAMGYSEIAETNYSEILKSVESSHASERFTTDMMREVLNRTKSPTYSNNTACFWCCHPFNWKATVLPLSYDAYENMYACEGHYCSPECALAMLYSDASLSDTARWTRHALLVDLYRSLYKNKDITPAPPRSTLRLFGGPLDIEQFREYVTGSEDMVAVALPPLRLHIPTMNVQGPVRDVKKFVALSQETVEKASKELRLKRSKPVHNNVRTLPTVSTFGSSLPVA
jgi:hypothetical protein